MVALGRSAMSRSIIVLGAGGHAKVVIEILQHAGEQVDYCVASGAAVSHCLSVEVLAGDEQLTGLFQRGYRRVFPAVGDNALRLRLAEEAQRLGFELASAVSPQSLISRSARLGHGVAIMPGAIVNADVAIGDLAIINTGATVDHDCQIGIGAHVAPNCTLAGGVTVGRAAFIGAGSVVIPGVMIGEKALIGAGGVVVRDVPASVIAFGNPAQVTSRRGD